MAWDATICFAWILYFSTHFNRGNPLHHPLVYNVKAVPRVEVRILSMEVPMKAKLI